MSSSGASMESETPDPFRDYFVVKSIHDDYSIWPVVKDMPAGWTSIGISGNKGECLEWIQNNWEGPTLKKIT